jgi:hypothetical protein
MAASCAQCTQAIIAFDICFWFALKDQRLRRIGRVAGSTLARTAPYPRRNLGGAFETGATKFCHPVQHADTNPGLRFLVLKAARF